MNGARPQDWCGSVSADGLNRDRRTAARPARIVVLVPWDRTRAWVARLVDVLRLQSGLPAEMRRAERGLLAHAPIPSEQFELRLFGASQHAHSAWVDTSAVPPADAAGGWADCLIVNCTGRDPQALPPEIRDSTVISPVFHGRFEMEGVAGPLLRGEPPHVGVVLIHGDEPPRLLQGARLAVLDPAAMPRALDVIYGRTITLLRGAADHLMSGKPLAAPAPQPVPAPILNGADYWRRRLQQAGFPKFVRQLRKPFVVHDDWCVGYRRVGGEAAPADLRLAPSTFHLIKSGRGCFYADPFIMRHDGVTALFFEDYDHRTRRARISYVALAEDGTHGGPFEALSRPYHLSYPFLFSHAGRALMVPETSGNRTIELYEAEPFPSAWRLRAVLVENVEAADATLHFDPATGIWWMFAAVTEFGSSPNDTLSIFFSDGLDGPWRPHPANPVKLDPGSARPAGPLLRWESRLFRPAQDCTEGYGHGLVWCEIKELTPTTFREEVVARFGPPRGYTGLHTYGRAAGFEVVDFKRDRLRFGH